MENEAARLQHPHEHLRVPVVVFLQRLLAEQPTQRRAPGTAGHLALVHRIGSSADGMVSYVESDFDAARALLERHGFLSAAADRPVEARKPPISSPGRAAPQVDFLVQPRSRGDSALLAVHFANSMAALPVGVHFAAIPWTKALAIPAEVIVACGSLDALRVIGGVSWLRDKLRGRAAVGVFTGGPGLFKRHSAQQFLTYSELPVLRLDHFMPEALLEAMATPRLEDICLPDEADLEQFLSQARPSPWFARQLRTSSRALDACEHPAVMRAWKRLQGAKCGLNCEWFPGVRQSAELPSA